MDLLGYCYYALIAVIVLYGAGMFFWGYHTALKKATDEIKEILDTGKGD